MFEYKPRNVFDAFHERVNRFGVIVAHRRAGKTVACVNDLIMNSRTAGYLGLTMKEIASLCTLGFIVSQEPELESMLQYLLSRTSPVDEMLN